MENKVAIKVDVTSVLVAVVDSSDCPRFDHFSFIGKYGKRDVMKMLKEKYGDTVKDIAITSIGKAKMTYNVNAEKLRAFVMDEGYYDDRLSSWEREEKLDKDLHEIFTDEFFEETSGTTK